VAVSLAKRAQAVSVDLVDGNAGFPDRGVSGQAKTGRPRGTAS
jgi:hypothetical protein